MCVCILLLIYLLIILLSENDKGIFSEIFLLFQLLLSPLVCCLHFHGEVSTSRVFIDKQEGNTVSVRDV